MKRKPFPKPPEETGVKRLTSRQIDLSLKFWRILQNGTRDQKKAVIGYVEYLEDRVKAAEAEQARAKRRRR